MSQHQMDSNKVKRYTCDIGTNRYTLSSTAIEDLYPVMLIAPSDGGLQLTSTGAEELD